MKRKKGHKKGKSKQSASSIQKSEDNSVLDDTDNAESGSPMEVEPSPSEGFDEPMEVLTDRPAGPGLGRVKVKLKSSKMLDPLRPHVDVVMPSDMEKRGSQLALEKQGEVVVEKVKDGVVNLAPERKAGNIKIKSSRALGSLNTILSQTSSHLQGQSERSTHPVVDRFKHSYQREHKAPRREARYNEQELSAALAVIKKVMKMDAADPFNVPVDPIALGIPDYFDIIKTPMDFGTICKNLEHGNMYMNSENVYKDVQYIWENCYRYNNKGDYIIELMKRVKKNFMKYWTSAGLYTDQPNRMNDAAVDQDSGIELPPEDGYGKEEVLQVGGRKIESIMSKQEYVGSPGFNGTGNIQTETPAPSTRERLHMKRALSKQKKRGGHGINKHKSDCLCAVCVVRRRRREREENAQVVESQIEMSDGNKSQEFRQEETSLENPYSEDTSSNSDGSPGLETIAKCEEQDSELQFCKSDHQDSDQQKKCSEDVLEFQIKNESSEQLLLADGSGEEPNLQSQSEEMEDSGFMTQTNTPKGDTPLKLREEEARKRKQVELQERQKQTKMSKSLLCDQNPSILKLCGTLFSNDHKSIWSGPHSLVRQGTAVRKSSALHAAVAMFMKK